MSKLSLKKKGRKDCKSTDSMLELKDGCVHQWNNISDTLSSKITVFERIGKAASEACVPLVSPKYLLINNVAMSKSSVFSLEIRRWSEFSHAPHL